MNKNNVITVGQMRKATGRSHELQSQGVDYQEAAAVACRENNIPLNSEYYNDLTTSCGPGCFCEFCGINFPFNPETDVDHEPLQY